MNNRTFKKLLKKALESYDKGIKTQVINDKSQLSTFKDYSPNSKFKSQYGVVKA